MRYHFSPDTLVKIFSAAFFYRKSNVKKFRSYELCLPWTSPMEASATTTNNNNETFPFIFPAAVWAYVCIQAQCIFIAPRSLIHIEMIGPNYRGKTGQKSKNSKFGLGKDNDPNHKRSKIWRKNHRWSKSPFRLHTFIIRKPWFALIKSILKHL